MILEQRVVHDFLSFLISHVEKAQEISNPF